MLTTDQAKQAKSLQDTLLAALGGTAGGVFDDKGNPIALIAPSVPAAAPAVAALDPTAPIVFRHLDPTVRDTARFMNSLGALLVNTTDAQTDTFSKLLTAIMSSMQTINREVSDSLDTILHDPEFQALEATWVGLNDLVSSVEANDVIIDYLDVSKDELKSDLADHDTDIFGSALFRKLYVDEYDRYGGKPFSAMVGLYEWDSGTEDIAALTVLGKIANASHSPFVSSVDPKFFLPAKTMEEVASVADLDALLKHPRFGDWNKLRETEGAAYLGLTLPRYLLRAPWESVGQTGNQVVGYRERVRDAQGQSHFLWGNSAILFAKNMVRSYEQSGWAQHIRGPKGGGIVDDLLTYTPDGLVFENLQLPVEIAIADYRELQFARNGFIALVHKKNESIATFFSAQSVKAPLDLIDDVQAQNAQLVTNLAYTLSITRVAHFVKRMMREYIGSSADSKYIEQVLSEWLSSYVTTVTNPDDLTLLYYPFKATSVTVEPKPGMFGWYRSIISILPHAQFEGMDVELRLEASLGGK